MRLHYLLASIATLGLFASTPALAHEPYLSLSGGYTMPGDDVEFTDLEDENFGPIAADATMELDDGVSGAVAAGWDWGKFRLEGEAAYRWNETDEASFGGITILGSDTDFESASLMVNALFDLPINDRFEFYVGAGAGVAAIQVDGVSAFAGPASPGEYDIATWAIAYQGLAGMAYHLDDNWTLTAGYRIWSTLDADLEDSWEDDELSGDLEMPLFHTVEVGLRYTW